MSWDEVALRYGTDKASSHHGYMAHYERLLAGRSVARLLEIGVAGGRSIAMWAELLPETLIVGVDNDDACALIQRPRQRVVIADAADPAKMAAVHTLYGPFDFIVDDGSHEHHDVNMAFEELYPHLVPGGRYVIEDLDPHDEWVIAFAARWNGRIIRCADDPLGCLIVMEKP